MSGEEDHLDDKVAREPSFLKKVWNKGKYAVAVLGVVYVVNGGYHLVQAARYQEEFKLQRTEVAAEALILLGIIKGGGNGFDERLKEFKKVANDRRAETLAQMDYHLWKAANPFYKVIPR